MNVQIFSLGRNNEKNILKKKTKKKTPTTTTIEKQILKVSHQATGGKVDKH